MSSGDERLAVAAQWIAKAENDLKTAECVLKLAKGCLTDTACFHAQQCVEKYLKGLLTALGRAFPKTHSVSELLALLPRGLRVSLSAEEQERLTDYATVTRYPGEYEEIPRSEARQAARIARRVRREVRNLLPKGTLRRRRA